MSAWSHLPIPTSLSPIPPHLISSISTSLPRRNATIYCANTMFRSKKSERGLHDTPSFISCFILDIKATEPLYTPSHFPLPAHVPSNSPQRVYQAFADPSTTLFRYALSHVSLSFRSLKSHPPSNALYGDPKTKSESVYSIPSIHSER